jgi:hypothetical protein
VATIKQVEKRIYDVEGFNVRVRHGRDSRDVRSDKGRVKQYGYRRALKHSKRVSDWRDGRFARTYPGFVVDVLHADGRVAHGRTLLGTVRDSYLEEE